MRPGARSGSAGLLLELLQVNEVADHFLPRDMVEQAQHPLEQKAVVTAAELLGHDDAGMGARPLATPRGGERNREY
jgi:hypothetical protein